MMEGEGETNVFMLVLDLELLLFVGFDTFAARRPVLMLRCERQIVEDHVIECFEEEQEEDSDEEECCGMWVPIVFPTEAEAVAGGSHHFHQNQVGFMAMFEDPKTSPVRGEQIVAASTIMASDSYNPIEEISLDPVVEHTRRDGSTYKLTSTYGTVWDDTAHLVLQREDP